MSVSRLAAIYNLRSTGPSILDDLSPADTAIYAYLAWRYDETKGRAFPALNTIARDTNLSRSQVKVSLNTLEQHGLMSRTHRFVEGRQTSNDYKVFVPRQRRGRGVPKEVSERPHDGPGSGPTRGQTVASKDSKKDRTKDSTTTTTAPARRLVDVTNAETFREITGIKVTKALIQKLNEWETALAERGHVNFRDLMGCCLGKDDPLNYLGACVRRTLAGEGPPQAKAPRQNGWHRPVGAPAKLRTSRENLMPDWSAEKWRLEQERDYRNAVRVMPAVWEAYDREFLVGEVGEEGYTRLVAEFGEPGKRGGVAHAAG